ncbi:hypothetical protein HC766_09415 [Candidatus Gracilibacteria bacterium]|nr:hypothetical protein [Candidatus Gracilibacteria bacterium]
MNNSDEVRIQSESCMVITNYGIEFNIVDRPPNLQIFTDVHAEFSARSCIATDCSAIHHLSDNTDFFF